MSAVARVSKPADRTPLHPLAAVEIGDTAGLETCATTRHCLATKFAQATKTFVHGSTDVHNIPPLRSSQNKSALSAKERAVVDHRENSLYPCSSVFIRG